MPHLSLEISQRGPLLQFSVGVSSPRASALRAAGKLVPAIIPITGLIDTGASCTSIDNTILRQLDIPSTGTTPVHTPSTQANAPHIANLYDISLTLIHPLVSRTFHAVPVMESQLLHQGIQALIGRDILSWCLFTYDGNTKRFCLAF
jgi:Retroviral aspartyl protease